MQHEWMNDTYRQAGQYLIRLINGALHNQDAGEKPEQIGWDQLYHIAKRNAVEGISFCGIRCLAEKPEQELYGKWDQSFQMTCYRKLRFDAEREQILQKLSENGISYLPLKGILLADYYPEPGMRSMADNDILYGFVETTDTGEHRIAGETEREREVNILSAQKLLVKIMKDRDYTVKSLVGNHDVFLKEPMFNFEMHRRLISKSGPFFSYYKNPWLRAVQDEKNPFLYFFSDEDEYIYLLVHSFKHFDNNGCGIRFLIDTYVFLEKKGSRLDWNYVKEELRKLELSDFEKQMREIAQAAFGENRTLSREQEEIICYLLGCGTYGNMQVKVGKQLQKIMDETGGNARRAKSRYISGRMILGSEVVQGAFPFFYKYWVFRPLLPVYRVVSALILRPQNVFSEMKILRKSLKNEKET